MRRHLNGTSRAGRLVASLAAIMALILAADAGSARAQDAKKASTAPTPLDTRPLARYVPRDDLSVFFEFDGLDLQADAWTKTATYKMLTQTPLGEMLETMGTQLADKALALRPGGKATGVEVMAVVKHALKSGFVFGVNPIKKGEDHGTLVIRNGAAKEVRAPFSLMLGSAMGENKPAVAKKAGRTVVTVPMLQGKDSWTWWSEKNDLVITLGKGAEDAVISTLDGQRPNAIDHPIRADLAKAEGNFVPVARMFVDYQGVKNGPTDGPFAQQKARMAAAGLDRIDYRWGFSDNALMSITRLKAAKPRRGLLALFDQPALDKNKLPALPEGLESFTVVSLDPIKSFDAYMAMQPPDRKNEINAQLDTLKSKQRVDLRKDVLGHLGPRFSFFTVPGGSAAPPRDTEKKETAPAGAGALGSMMGLGGFTLPRYAIVTEVDDPVAFGKALDNLIIAINHQLRTVAEQHAAAAQPEEGEEPDRGRAPRGARGGSGAAAPKFAMMGVSKETEKTYTLTFPAELAKAAQLPSTFRPTIRLSGKHLAIAVAPDAARAAMEAKAGAWKPSSDLASAFDELPQSLMLLNVSDPRNSAPENLATLPGTLQRGVNALVTAVTSPPSAVAAASSAPGLPGAPGNSSSAGGSSAGGSSAGFADSAAIPSSSSFPTGGSGGSSSVPGAPGAPGSSAVPGGPADAAAGAMLSFNIDPAKLPKPADLRALMFPATYAVDVSDDEVRIVNRESFPSQINTIASAAKLLGSPLAQMAIFAGRAQMGARMGGKPTGATPPADLNAPAPATPPADRPQGDLPGRPGRGGRGGRP